MALSSMTGFARSHGTSGPYAFEWELKSVNAKGFDFRMRLPPGGSVGTIAAFDKMTGNRRWAFGANPPGYSSPTAAMMA